MRLGFYLKSKSAVRNPKSHHSTLFLTSAVAALLLIAFTFPVLAAPTSQQIISMLKKNYMGVKDYKVDAVLTVKSPQVNVTGMSMTVYFKQPDKIHIDAKDGFAMLPRDIRLGNPAVDLPKNFDIKVLGTGKSGGRNVASVKLIPKHHQDSSPQAIKAWIDTDRGVILTTILSTDNGHTIKSTWEYVKVAGKYWLPSRIKAQMSVPQAEDTKRPNHSPRRQMTNGTITLKFKNYKVNQKIPDSIFKEPAESR